MKILDENELAEVADDTKAPDELGEEDEDFLNSLEKMVKEVEDDPDSID